jgi:uncharacterized protein (DUF362 family)
MQQLKSLGAGQLTIGDRSGMGNTRAVMETKDLFALAKNVGAKVVIFDELAETDFQHARVDNMHWQRGFALPKPVLQADAIVTTCCLKTHRYGGHFTLSLKNSVGLAAKQLPGDSYNYMRELHGSTHQRRMIAEINAAYTPTLVVIDGIHAFADGGPDRGRLVDSNVILAGSDRIALDAVGVALLRHFGTTPEVSQGTIFQQEQIARAVELNLGVHGPEQIVLLTDDDASAQYAKQIRGILDAAHA